ncbi:MAG: translation initiation factor [Myxococcota bacterium]
MSDEKKPFHNPFGALAGLKDGLPKGPEAKPDAKPEAPKGPPRAVVRLERAGRKGKEVTVIEHLDLSLREREKWLTALKGALGCGGALEGDALVLQGDHRQRAAKWLEAKGVKKVTLGS